VRWGDWTSCRAIPIRFSQFRRWRDTEDSWS
jgi:hypothetical protein